MYNSMSSSESESSEEDESLDQQIALQTAALTRIHYEIDSLLLIMQQVKEILDIQNHIQNKLQTWEFNTTGSHILYNGTSMSVYQAIKQSFNLLTDKK